MQRQIFAIGGKFSVESWQQPLLQRHLLGLAKRPTPRICLLAGASGDSATAIETFYRELNQHDCRPFHLNMYKPVTRDFEDFFRSMDIVYVSGGATKNLVAVWRDWGVDGALRAAWDGGVIMSGTSAGSICWFESGLTDSFPTELLPVDCTGMLPGSGCPHYDSRPDRAPIFRRLIADGTMPSPGIGTDDDTAAHYIDGALHEVVSQRATAGACIVARTNEGFSETPIPVRFLG